MLTSIGEKRYIMCRKPETVKARQWSNISKILKKRKYLNSISYENALQK